MTPGPAPCPNPWLPEPATHGALDYAELEQLGIAPDSVIDFSSNINPYGPAPAVRRALQAVAVERYPDRQSLGLRRALSAHLDIPYDQILPGNGSAELIWLAALAYLQPGDAALVIGPTFGEYAHAARLAGASVESVEAQAPGFALDPTQVQEQLSAGAYRLAFVCNPNNPTGQAVPPEAIAAWAAAAPQTLLVVDEAYIQFAPRLNSVIRLELPNLLVLRSMTKEYALAGLRLGYAVAERSVIRALAAVQPPWSVSAPAQAAGLAALGEHAAMQANIQGLRRAVSALQVRLRALGWVPLVTETAFFLLPVGNGAAFRTALLRRGLQVRDCASFGLPAYVRIAARRPEENERLLAAIAELELEQIR